MPNIISYNLLRYVNGYVLYLYLEPINIKSLREYLRESKEKDYVDDEIKDFVDNYLSHVDIVAINIMSGHLLLCTIPYDYIVNQQSIDNNKQQEYTNKNRDVLDTETKIDTVSNNYLILVNKQNALPSDYVPKDLIVPNVSFPFIEFQEKKQLSKQAALALEKLFNKAKIDEIDLYAISGYRSYPRQKLIYDSNVKEYGEEEANQFSAKPGESEHQTGLAMDVSAPSVDLDLVEEFGDTKEGKWLKENAPSFGYIIRYPKGKEEITGYQYEPWHLRYVGVDAASVINKENLTLEEFLEK
ncbi:M15 family metallopeptidase [Mycoplasmatota bacterium WC44]